MTSSVEIRTATQNEAAAVFDLLMNMYTEMGLGSVSPEKVKQKIAHCIDRGCILLAVLSGQIVGTVGLEFAQWWWHDDWHVSEMWTYVKPSARRSAAAKLLLRAMSDAARANKVPLVYAVFTPVETERKKKFFGRFGRPMGAIYVGGDAEGALRRF